MCQYESTQVFIPPPPVYFRNIANLCLTSRKFMAIAFSRKRAIAIFGFRDLKLLKDNQRPNPLTVFSTREGGIFKPLS
ncbi:hypothetical protein H6F79_00330 [Trichocoleus sp. FACHB-69]|nr:hypothetical protein [Trichocoleus sp. FACHB-69]